MKFRLQKKTKRCGWRSSHSRPTHTESWKLKLWYYLENYKHDNFFLIKELELKLNLFLILKYQRRVCVVVDRISNAEHSFRQM